MENAEQHRTSPNGLEDLLLALGHLSSAPLAYFLAGVGFAVASMINSNFPYSAPATIGFAILSAGLFIAGSVCHLARSIERNRAGRESESE